MVSADLFHASEAGDLNKVNQLLAQSSPLDIEEKGASPFLFFSHICLIVPSILSNIHPLSPFSFLLKTRMM